MDQDATKAQFMRAHEAYSDSIFRFCVVKVTQREVAVDLTQEVFMRFWQALREGKEMQNERAFLYTIARNLIIDWYRKKKDTSLDALHDGGLDFGNDEHQHILERAEFREVLSAIETLDDASREVLMLRYVEGLSPKEIAESLQESANTVSVRINRAIKKVQDIIQPNHE